MSFYCFAIKLVEAMFCVVLHFIYVVDQWRGLWVTGIFLWNFLGFTVRLIPRLKKFVRVQQVVVRYFPICSNLQLLTASRSTKWSLVWIRFVNKFLLIRRYRRKITKLSWSDKIFIFRRQVFFFICCKKWT